jgi:alanine racemase
VLDPSTNPKSRAWVEVRLDRLRENAAATQRAIGPEMGLVPMVKAEAYGLGMERVVGALRSLTPDGPWGFGVASVTEGERLRRIGWSGRALVFSPTAAEEFPRAAAAGLTLCLSEVAAVKALAAVAAKLDERLPFHVEIDTGMGRAGFSWSEAAEWGPAVADAARNLRWEGTFTHFHSADEPDLGPTDEQWHRFREALERLPTLEPAPVLHVANSAAALRRGGYGCHLARPGIYLYGGRAGPDHEPAPVVSLRARLTLVRNVSVGSTVGYGATYRARGPERWGTLPIGYGDGVPRALARGGGEVVVRGRRAPIIGRVSMDMITVDLTSIPDAAVGDVATLIGDDGPESIPVDEVAARCDTISYEILTGLTTRLPRVYLERELAAASEG